MTLRPGTEVAGYRIDALLGRGGMGEVYRASHARLDRPVALKLLPAAMAEDAGSRERFLAESRFAASLDHPHIVPIYEIGEHDGRPFIAMRFVDGSDLAALLARDGPLEPERAIRLLAGIADALDTAHERGLVHRDVKPENILVAASPRGEHAYLADFGLGKRLGSGGQTMAGQLLGSVDYAAPEQIEGGPSDGSVDIYALAGVLYACLTTRPPFPSESAMATLWAHINAAPPRVSDARPEAAPFDAVIARGLAKTPDERFGTATELISAASDAGQRPSAGPSPTPEPVGRTATSRSPVGPDVPALPAMPAPIGPFVGRERELSELRPLLSERRLVTIVGPGGVGKTRLALEAGRTSAGDFDVVAFVDVSPVTNPSAILATIVEALHLETSADRLPETTIAEALAGKRALLILDNLEQVAAGAPALAVLLGVAPDLRLLATSRIPLALRGEREFRLGPLPLPSAGDVTLEAIAASDAVKLFIEEVQRHSDATLSASNAASVAEICRRLDGLPLALEVVAARVRTLPIAELPQRLEQRIDLPAADADVPARQRTLRAAIAWSTDMLAPPTRQLFCRLGVFVGGFSPEGAAWIGDGSDPTDTLDELARHSLLVRRGENRLGMLETIREFAVDELRAAGDEAWTRDRQIDWLATLLTGVEDAFVLGHDQAAALDRAEPERANIRDAIQWAAANGREPRALHLASAKNYWSFRGMGAEMRPWLEDLLARPTAFDDLTRATGRTTLGSIYLRAGELDKAGAEYMAARDLWERLGERRKVAVIDNNLSIVAERRDDFEGSRRHLERALAVMRELNDSVGIAAIVGNLGVLAMRRDDLDAAEALNQEAAAIARKLGDEETLAIGLTNLAAIALERGNAREARPYLAEALELCARLDDAEGSCTCIELAGQTAGLEQRFADQVRLISGADRVRGESGFARSPSDHREFAEIMDAARERLGDGAYATARQEGLALSRSALVDLAREQVREQSGIGPHP
jgi:non-specific serine/threonine protein kinase